MGLSLNEFYKINQLFSMNLPINFLKNFQNISNSNKKIIEGIFFVNAYFYYIVMCKNMKTLLLKR